VPDESKLPPDVSKPLVDHAKPLLEWDAAADPFEQFASWYADASTVVRVPEAVAVATATPDGSPSVRMVLMKAWDRYGFVFYTHYPSRKGSELESNPKAALMFYWDELGRQVRIEGDVERVSARESDDYFATRPFGAQVSAHASNQSEPVESRAVLDERAQELAASHAGSTVPRPLSWGGYRVVPRCFEFWQNRDDRLHDRLRYTREGELWRIERLQP
jgi:pyridoxamine 5'-phosphate oxidase